MFIHERDNWTEFKWDAAELTSVLECVHRKQGELYGRLASIGFDAKIKAMAENLTLDVLSSSEIEGVRLNKDEVRSSVARKLGIESIKQSMSSRYVDSVVTVTVEALKACTELLTKEKLCAWQSAFFPEGYSSGFKIEVGKYRTNEEHIVSGMFGRERVHYIAPSPERVEREMSIFLKWFNGTDNLSSVVRSAIAHLWFVSIHPFEDGNGRLARILSDIILARADGGEYRFYNVSSQISKYKRDYYRMLEKNQRGTGDITEWLHWYAQMLSFALDDAKSAVGIILNKSVFWQNYSSVVLNQRQIDVLNIFLDGYEAKITSKMWASLVKCSKDSAIRDIQDLVMKGILKVDVPGAKRPTYSIVYTPDEVSRFFSCVNVLEENGCFYVKALYKDNTHVCERILKLDAERFLGGGLPLERLLSKYFSYLLN